MEISQQIEALLFFKGEPVNVAFLSKTLNVSPEEVLHGLAQLEHSLSGRGIILMQNAGEYMLASSPQMGALIETLIKEELGKELGKAGLETLATILYRGPISRSEINYLRGVNSNYILRSLLVRGLIEKVDQGGRNVVYQPTFELLSFMGVNKVADLPQYEDLTKAVEEFKESQDHNELDED